MASISSIKLYSDYYAQGEILRHLTNGYTRNSNSSNSPLDVHYLLTRTDRLSIKGEADSVIQDYAQDNDADMGQLAAVIDGVQQEERRRRDTRISLATHKELISSALDTAYKRSQHLNTQAISVSGNDSSPGQIARIADTQGQL